MARSIVARDELEIGAHYVYTFCLFPILRDSDWNGYYKFLLLLYVVFPLPPFGIACEPDGVQSGTTR